MNNSLSLLQQGIEIALKARIARVSPFLLIAGDPQSWSKVDAEGNVDFSDLKTIDAIHLVKAANAVSDSKLKPEFTELYDRLRRKRNKIQHLDGRVIKNEGASILVEIMQCQPYLYPGETWATFRRTHLEIEDGDNLFVMQLEDYSRTTWMAEMEAAFRVLDETQIFHHLRFNLSAEAHACPSCLSSRADNDGCDCCFVQVQEDGKLRCASCEIKYMREEYDTAMLDWV